MVLKKQEIICARYTVVEAVLAIAIIDFNNNEQCLHWAYFGRKIVIHNIFIVL